MKAHLLAAAAVTTLAACTHVPDAATASLDQLTGRAPMGGDMEVADAGTIAPPQLSEQTMKEVTRELSSDEYQGRAPGSIGAGTTPGRVFKGTRMAGRLGGKRESVLNLEIVKIQPERGLVFIRGGVPGAPQGIVKIRQTTRVVRVAAQG